jgi:hypothetical protein
MSFRRICFATINGRRWEIGFGFPGKTKGKVDEGVANYERRRIVLRRKIKGRKCSLLDGAIHELLHAAVPSLNEEVVDDFGELCGRVLPKLLAAEADKH